MLINLEEEILKATEYKSGYKQKDNEYVISASMVGNELLQNYLSIVFGKQKQKQIKDPTLGTIFHRGMDALIQRDNNYLEIQKEFPMYMKLENDWILSGTADLIVMQNFNYEIHDYKFAKSYTMKMFKKEINTHSYTKQLIALKFLLKEQVLADPIELYCDFFLKDAKIIEGEKILHQIKVESNLVESTFIENLINHTNELQKYIEEGKVPPKCKDTWPRKLKGKFVQMKCQYYCSQGAAGNCPYYDPMNETTMIDFANWAPNG